MAASMVLLLAAGLVTRGLVQSLTIHPGFETSNISVVDLDLQEAGYDATRAAAFHRTLAERLAALPGVDATAQARTTPLSGSHVAMAFTGSKEKPAGPIELNFVSPAFFSILRIHIVAGRTFTDDECRIDAHVLVVTESTARRFWPGENPLGKRLQQMDGKSPVDFEVIGVAKDTRMSHLAYYDSSYLYLPASPALQLRMGIFVHVATDYASTADAVRAGDFGRSIGIPSTNRQARGQLRGLAAAVAHRGVHGRRARRSGPGPGRDRHVRRCRLYSEPSRAGDRDPHRAQHDGREVMRLVLRQVMRPVLIGGLAGLALGAAAAKLLSDLLYGVSPSGSGRVRRGAVVLGRWWRAWGQVTCQRSARPVSTR